MPRTLHRWLSWTLAPLAALSLAAACGGRTLTASLDDDDGSGGGGGETSSGGAGGSGGSPGVGGHGGGVGEGGSTSTGPGPLDCLTCIGTQCPAALQCVTDPGCVQGMVCAVSQCLGGGGQPDLMCVVDCFNGDISAALTAIQAITCILGDCGDECGGLLPGGGFPGP